VNIDIDDIIGTGIKLLPPSGGRLEESKEAIYKLNSVSETISEMAASYNEVAVATVCEEGNAKKEARKVFAEELYNNIEELTENILYEDIMYQDEIVIDNIFSILEKQETISRDELLKVFEQNNSYIIGIDSEDEEIKNEIESDIKKIVKTINDTYKINKLNLIWKQKEASNRKTLANQLGGVSKVISSVAEDMKTGTSGVAVIDAEPKFKIEIGVARTTKNKSEISGDSSTQSKLNDGKYMLAISDGMGSGQSAKRSSSTVIKMLDRLLTSGFDKDISIGLINSAINLNSSRETYATIDISVIDLMNGNIEFVKNGACPTFVKSRNKVEIIKAISLPAGMLDNIELVVYDKDISGGEIVVMCSDGVIDSNAEYTNKELWVRDLLENIETEDVQKIADLLVNESIDNNLGLARDDMTVLVAKIAKI